LKTINNEIPLVPENTTDPAAGLNLSLKDVDALLQAAVLSIINDPPASPAEGDRHLVEVGTGAWAGKDDLIAQFLDGAWSFYAARYAVNLDDGLLYFRAASGWSAADTGGTAFADITGSPDDNAALAAALDAKEDAVQDNLSASVPPTVDNDEAEGYAPRSRWFDIVAGESYLCLSADDGDAVWVQTSLTLDELGSAALADVGTADDELPTNANVDDKLDLKADKTDARLSDAREWTATEVSQPEAETGEATTARKWTALRVRQAILGWWNGITSAWGRGLVASTDAAAGRSALGLGTFATANYSAAPFINVMPDSGRFAGKVNPLLRELATGFSSNTFFASFNSAAQSSAGKFIHNNTNNGGSAGVMTDSVVSLLSAMGRSSDRYGVEFYVARITAGSGTAGASVGLDGVTRHLLTTNGSKALFASSRTSTFVGWVRARTGSAHILSPTGTSSLRLGGVATPQGTPLSGWQHVAFEQVVANGYDNAFPWLCATVGAEIEIAIPAVFTGIVDAGIHTSPIPTINELSA